MIKISTLQTIVNSAQALDGMRPRTGNQSEMYRQVHEWSVLQIGEFFRNVDQLCLNARLLAAELDRLELPVSNQ